MGEQSPPPDEGNRWAIRAVSNARALLKDWLPPIALRASRRIWNGGIRFEGDYTNWDEAADRCSGYSAEHILAKVLEATLKVKRGEAAFERDSVLFDEIEYSWPVLAELMWAAACNGGALDVLDFGGALGSTYFQNRNFLQTLREVRWNVIEQSHYVEAGKEHIQDKNLRFYQTIEACIAENKPNVVLLSSVLQYLPDPFSMLEDLSKCGASCMIIDRTPYSNRPIDSLVIQQVPSRIYKASYPMWIFAWTSFVQCISNNWTILASSPCPEGQVKTSQGLPFYFKGMLLVAKQCSQS